MRSALKTCLLLLAATATSLTPMIASAQDRPAKEVFGHIPLPSNGSPTSHGSYAKGCQAGAVALATDGESWQSMRLSRNRRWGQPQLVRLIERFSRDAQQLGWSGLLVGDLSQPRGGPMLFGHASHQIGLDADIWFQQMPSPRLSEQAREKFPFVSMLDKSKFLTVDDKKWTPTHARLVMKAASYPEVERLFVNPAIKKKLCETWTGDRSLLGKVRPVYGHDEHFHIRMQCPAGSKTCKRQAAVAAGDGCDKSLAWWFTPEPWAKPKPKPDAPKPKPPRPMMVSDLPPACAAIARADFSSAAAQLPSSAANPIPSPSFGESDLLPEIGPVPYLRPINY